MAIDLTPKRANVMPTDRVTVTIPIPNVGQAFNSALADKLLNGTNARTPPPDLGVNASGLGGA